MANIKISEKGRALLRKDVVSGNMVAAIVRNGRALFTKEGLKVAVDGNGKTITVRAASPSKK